VAAKRADVIGTDRTDIIRVAACRTTIKGMKGRDHLYGAARYRDLADPWIRPRCSNYEATIDGGPSIDFIEGSSGDDRLVGGRGRDTIAGGPGKDRLKGPRQRWTPARRLSGRAGAGLREAPLTQR
jgi:Ca2+-binding RTX toxin-like protein